MTTDTKLAYLGRWLLLVFPSYLRYLAMLDRNRTWNDRFPLEARDLMLRQLDEQTAFCQKLADRIDMLGGIPEVAQFPEDAGRLNYLEMAVAVLKIIERNTYNLNQLKHNRAAVTHDQELAMLLEEGIALMERQIGELQPLSAEFSRNTLA